MVRVCATAVVTIATAICRLGRPRALLQLAGTSYDLSRRHGEIAPGVRALRRGQ